MDVSVIVEEVDCILIEVSLGPKSSQLLTVCNGE